MADMSMHTVNNLAEAYGGGIRITKSFYELLKPEPEEKRTADEIISQFKQRLNGVKNESI